MVDGEFCPKCEKGKLKKFYNRIDKKMNVELFKCNKCKETWYSENVMKKVEAIKNGKKVN